MGGPSLPGTPIEATAAVEIAAVHEREFTARQRQIEERARTAREAARDLGLSFSSAFENAVVAGNSLRSVLGGLLQDIQRIILRRTITEPLIGALSGSLSSGFLGGLFGGGGAASHDSPAGLICL